MFLLCFFHSHISSVSNTQEGNNTHRIWNLAWLWRPDRKNILSLEVSQFVLTSLTESRFDTPQSHCGCYLPTVPTYKFTLPSVLKYGAVRTIYSIWQGATSHHSRFSDLQFRGNEFLALLPHCKSLALKDKSMSWQCIGNVEIIRELYTREKSWGSQSQEGRLWPRQHLRALQRSTWKFRWLEILWSPD